MPSRRQDRDGDWVESAFEPINLPWSIGSFLLLLRDAVAAVSLYSHQQVADWAWRFHFEGTDGSLADIDDPVLDLAGGIALDIDAQWDLFLVNTYSPHELRKLDLSVVCLPTEWWIAWGVEFGVQLDRVGLEPLDSRILRLEESHCRADERSLGAALAIAIELWNSGGGSRELGHHLIFLSWYCSIEPPFLTGCTEERVASNDLAKVFQQVFAVFEDGIDADPERVFVVGLISNLTPWLLGGNTTGKEWRVGACSLRSSQSTKVQA